MDISLVVLTGAIATILVFHIRIVREDERLVVHRLGQFHGLRGPGLVFKLYIDTAEPLAIGARGEALGTGAARFGAVEAPVQSEDAVGLGSVVRVVGFGEDRVQVTLDTDQTRSFVCQKCGHPNTL